MKILDIRSALLKHQKTELKGKRLVPPPEARFITSDPEFDAHLYFLETEFGIRVLHDKGTTAISEYDIVDEKKYAMFVLRWC